MTEPKQRSASRLSRAAPFHVRRGRLAFALISMFFLGLLLRNAEVAIAYLSEGLALCAKTLIPSLFPFMVLSELIVSSGAMRPLGRLLARPFHRLFHVGGEGAGALLLGFLCGFPLGTKTAVSLYRQGRLSLEELRRLLTFCNVPSAAFLINAVGISLFGRRSLGVELYVVTLLSSLLIGIFGARLERERDWEPVPPPPLQAEKKSALTAFTGAVSSSAFAMLHVCAFVIFFSAAVGILEEALSSRALPRELTAFCFGLFELTGGMSRAAACAPEAAPYLCAFMAGWSGLSVHFQIMSLCDEIPISPRSYFVAKLAQGLLNVLLLWGYRFLFGLLHL